MNARSVVSTVFVFAGFAPFAMAEYDISPRIESGAIKTNAFFDAEEVEVENVRVFGYSFGEDPLLLPNQLQDPGFHPLPGSGFPGGAQIGVDAQGVLQYWNGGGPVGFTPASAGTSLAYAFGSSNASVDGTTIPAADVLLGPVDASGEFDDHLDTEITASAAAGIYLFPARLNTTASGITPSENIYMLFNFGLSEEQLDQAVEYARDTFAPGSVIPVVPEPATLAIGAAALPLFARRRRT